MIFVFNYFIGRWPTSWPNCWCTTIDCRHQHPSSSHRLLLESLMTPCSLRTVWCPFHLCPFHECLFQPMSVFDSILNQSRTLQNQTLSILSSKAPFEIQVGVWRQSLDDWNPLIYSRRTANMQYAVPLGALYDQWQECSIQLYGHCLQLSEGLTECSEVPCSVCSISNLSVR